MSPDPLFVKLLEREFRGRLRVRWSSRKHTFEIEQKVGRAAYRPIRWLEEDDTFVCARDGYVHVLSVAPGDTVRQEFIEVRLSQDVLRADSRRMACRLLVAARTSPYRSSRGPGEATSVAEATFGALGRRVSAGLSVAF